MSLVGAAEDGATKLENADGIGGFQETEIAGGKQTLEAIAKADNFPAKLMRRADDPVNYRIKSGAIAAAV